MGSYPKHNGDCGIIMMSIVFKYIDDWKLPLRLPFFTDSTNESPSLPRDQLQQTINELV